MDERFEVQLVEDEDKGDQKEDEDDDVELHTVCIADEELRMTE